MLSAFFRFLVGLPALGDRSRALRWPRGGGGRKTENDLRILCPPKCNGVNSVQNLEQLEEAGFVVIWDKCVVLEQTEVGGT